MFVTLHMSYTYIYTYIHTYIHRKMRHDFEIYSKDLGDASHEMSMIDGDRFVEGVCIYICMRICMYVCGHACHD